MPRIALKKEERGRRPRGRWEDQVWKDIERRGLQKRQVEEEETWNDRQKWRRLCTTTRDNGNECGRLRTALGVSRLSECGRSGTF
ncbi:hypothetical protein J6590_014292 [Homalodisca vitripennis]|nr:hypothetical protein J6590_014292 [Homalodisca vitripennis]